jgi:RNA polymerase sigma factor (sigma-70 family)
MIVDLSEKWLQEMSTGSVEAFEAFYKMYCPYILKLSLKLTRNPQEAEDLCHDVFMEVFCKADRFDSKRGSVKTWLTVKTRSRFLDRMRKAKRIVPNLESNSRNVIHEKGLDEILFKKVNHEELFQALSQLPQAQQTAVFKKYFHYQTQKEISLSMNKPIGTVKSLIRYGVINLRKLLLERGFFEAEG